MLAGPVIKRVLRALFHTDKPTYFEIRLTDGESRDAPVLGEDGHWTGECAGARRRPRSLKKRLTPSGTLLGDERGGRAEPQHATPRIPCTRRSWR